MCISSILVLTSVSLYRNYTAPLPTMSVFIINNNLLIHRYIENK